jgi:hypothetical protein
VRDRGARDADAAPGASAAAEAVGLAALQRAFHDACTGAAPLATAHALVREDGVDRGRRLHAYAHAYWARIAAALAEDYPKLQAWLGPAFPELVVPYLRRFPTRHPSLREAGLHLAELLADRGELAAADLARLERARLEAFDGPDAAPLSRDDVAAAPPEAFPSLPLRPVPTAALVELRTNADEIWDALEGERPAPEVAAGDRVVLVWRRGVTVIHRTLRAEELPAIRRLFAPAGALAPPASFSDVCDALAGDAAAVERALDLLLRWLDAELLAAAPPADPPGG